MSTENKSSMIEVSCTNCGSKFKVDVDDVLKKQIETRVAAEMDATYASNLQIETDRVRAEAKNNTDSLYEKIDQKDQELKKLKNAETQRKLLEDKIAEMESLKTLEVDVAVEAKLSEQIASIKNNAEELATKRADIQIKTKERELSTTYEAKELNLDQRIQDAVDKELTDTRLTNAELRKKVEDLGKMNEEMKRKVEQGSTQLQGEAQELELEEILRNGFKLDTITPVPKGFRGADCTLSIFGSKNHKIIYESKRTKDWGRDWIEKLKSDQLSASCDEAVIVTSVFPRELQRFGRVEGVWICSFAEVVPLTFILRDSLLRIDAVYSSEENKGEKMHMMYQYLMSSEFEAHVHAIVDAFTGLREQIITEKKVFNTQWSHREKELQKVLESTTSMYGALRSISGGAMPTIAELEISSMPLLPERT